MSNKDSQTKAFSTVDKKQKGFKSRKSRQKFVIAIFFVIILILSLLAFLIIGEVMERLQAQNPGTTTQPPENVIYVHKDYGNTKMGNLLLIDNVNTFDYKKNNMNIILNSSKPEDTLLPENLVNVWRFKHVGTANDKETKITIPGTSDKIATYGLGGYATSIVLDVDTLNAFNKMMLDYCATLDPKSYAEESASGLLISWGWSDPETLLEDLESSLAFHDNSLGNTINLKDNYGGNISESIFKSKYEWLYNNAHKYGFIIRYPNGCEHFSEQISETSIRIRYVGTVHATTIKEKGVCLDEYLADLRTNHKNYDKALEVSVEGKTYSVYYYESSAKLTSIPIPKNNKGYEISGDNMNGFIVTVEQ